MLGPTGRECLDQLFRECLDQLLGNAWTNCVGNDWTNCVGKYWTNCLGNYWTNCLGNYWTNCVGNYWTNCVGNYWTNELVLPLYGLTLNKDKLIFSGERLLKSTSISFGFLNKEMFQGTLISGLVGPQNINTLQVVLTLQFLISMLKVFKGQHPGIYWTL